MSKLFGKPITSREFDILCSLAEGKTQAEIAAELGIAHGSATQAVARLRGKLGARTAAQLVAEAYHRGILQVREAA